METLINRQTKQMAPESAQIGRRSRRPHSCQMRMSRTSRHIWAATPGKSRTRSSGTSGTQRPNEENVMTNRRLWNETRGRSGPKVRYIYNALHNMVSWAPRFSSGSECEIFVFAIPFDFVLRRSRFSEATRWSCIRVNQTVFIG